MGAVAPLLAVSAVSGLAGSYAQSRAQKAQGKYEQQMTNMAAQQRDIQAKDTIERGGKAANRVRREARGVQGSQRAMMAASGVDVTTGSARELLLETDALGQLDANTVRNNAFREAWGYETEGGMLRLQGQMARNTAKYESRNTLLTGGLNFAKDAAMGMYYNKQFKGESAFNPRNPTEASFNDYFRSKR